MAVAFDNVAEKDYTLSTSHVLVFTCTTNAALIVHAHVAGVAASLSAVEFGGTPMTRLGAVNSGSSRIEMWGLTDAPAGVLTMSAVVTGSTQRNYAFIVTSYVGAAGSLTFGDPTQGTSGVATVADFSVSSTSVDLLACGWALAGSAATLTAWGWTPRGTASGAAVLVAGDVTGAPTLSLSASSTTGRTWLFVGVPIHASVAAATWVPSLCLTGVG